MNFNLFLLEAAATTGEANAQTGGFGGLLGMALPFIIMLALMYFLIIRPQKKKEKAEKAMRDNLQVGDEIITIGGIYGRVISLKEDMKNVTIHFKI